MIRAVATLIAFGLLSIPLLAAQSTQQNEIPPCPPLPDSSKYYPDKMVRPKYPKDALRDGVGGTVELIAVVAPDGRTKDISVQSGNPEFSQAAATAIRKWQFHPEVRQGRQVETAFKIHVRFNPLLQEANSDVELESPGSEPPPASHLSTPHRKEWGIEVHYMSETGMVAPKAVYSPEPEFSDEARREQHQGNVGIGLVVDADGLPRNLEVVCSSVAENNENALGAVMQWKFAPGTKEGKPVAVAIEIEVAFELN